MRDSKLKFLMICLLSSAWFTLTGCEMYREPFLTQNRLQLHEGQFFEQIDVAAISDGFLEKAARDFEQSGRGPMDLAVTYDPLERGSATRASMNAKRLSSALRQKGVRDITVSILPVQGQGARSDALISYVSLTALPPSNCTLMDGVEDTYINPEADYRLGCTVETVLARQIARPKDLAGQESNGVTDGRRSANIIEVYRSGARNKPLKGESATQ